MASTFIKLPVTSGGGGGGAVDSFNGRTGVVVSQSGDYSAGIVSNTPAGNISATTVQAAINELDSEKQATITGAATTITSADLTASRALTSDGSGKVAVSAVTSTELGYVSGVTSAIQTQIDSKQASDADLTAIAALSTNGLIARTGAGTAAARTLTAGSSAVSVTNGDGVSGNPTVDLPNTGVSAGSYGSATQVPTVTVDAKGKVTAASNTSIAIPSTQVTNFTTAAQTAAVQNSLFGSSTVQAPSVSAVNAALNTVLLNPMTTAGDIIIRDASNTTARLPVGTVDQLLSVDPSGVPYWRDENLGQDFGGGSDGNVTITGVVTLTNPAYYDTLVMAPGGAIITSGYPLYAKTLDLSNCDVNCIRWNGNNGTASTAQAGGAGGGTLTTTMLGGAGGGSAGATSVINTVGAQAAVPGNATPSNGGAGGAGGAGGTGTAGAAAAGRAGGTATSFVIYDRFEQAFQRGVTLIVGGAPGAGGTAGSGSVTQTGRGGGGGGGGGGVVAIYCQTLITSASTPAGAISANGGNGGACNGTPSADAGGGAGGGGGGGGYVYLAYLEKQGATVNNLITANGGNGGNGGVGSSGASTAGAGGSGGSGGRIRVYNATTSTSVSAVGAAGSAGTSASGIVPGSGGAGGLCQLSL